MSDEPVCRWCGRTLEQHLVSRPQGASVPRMPCVGLKSGFLEDTTMATDQVWALFERMQGEIAREVRVMLGEEALDQRLFNDVERGRRIEALKLCARAQTDAASRHESWMHMHEDQGWVWGPEFKPDVKQHPNLLPWDQLPATTRSKARIFEICARYAAELAGLVKP